MSGLIMNEQMTIAIIQSEPMWQQPEHNREQLESTIKQLENIDLVILPEMFASGFSLAADDAEINQGSTYQWMQSLAADLNIAITGSIKTKAEDNAIFNRMWFIQPNKQNTFYDKRHLFGAENKRLSAGRDRVIVEYKGFRLLLQVCYDLRFPVFSRNQDDYDVIINVASWPEPRIHHWDALLKARAIENLSYVIGCNRVGEDGNGWSYVGHSQIIAPDGEVMIKAQNGRPEILSATIEQRTLQTVRKQYPFLQDRDSFRLL